MLGAACSGASEAAPWSPTGGLLPVGVRDVRFCPLVPGPPKNAREQDGRNNPSVH